MITVETIINAPMEVVWKAWNDLGDISNWAHASDDWAAEAKQNDLKPGGRFVYRMFAKDGSGGFDFSGAYDAVQENSRIEYTLDDKRKVIAEFTAVDSGVKVVQQFEAESENPEEMQRQGWQAILDNFKRYVEHPR